MKKLRANRTAVLFVDVLNHMQFPEGDALLANAMQRVGALRALRRAASRAQVPVIYANDNYGHWEWSPDQVVRHCSNRRHRGAPFSQAIAPRPRDYVVLKAKNSAFYCTLLDPMLAALHTETLVLGGLTGDNCVLFTAHDAYLRGLRLIVPEDCVASSKDSDNRRALEQMRASLKADTGSSNRISFG